MTRSQQHLPWPRHMPPPPNPHGSILQRTSTCQTCRRSRRCRPPHSNKQWPPKRTRGHHPSGRYLPYSPRSGQPPPDSTPWLRPPWLLGHFGRGHPPSWPNRRLLRVWPSPQDWLRPQQGRGQRLSAWLHTLHWPGPTAIVVSPTNRRHFQSHRRFCHGPTLRRCRHLPACFSPPRPASR